MTKTIFKTIALMGLLNSTTLKAQINPTNNFIGVDVSTFPQNASFDYDSCFALGANLGMGSMGLFQNWTAIETAPNTFNLTIFDIADYYYPLHNMPIDLTLTPIHTNNLEVPSDLTTTAFNNPILINRFKTLLDSVKAHIPNVTLSSLVIGSEHDVYMGTNATLWSQYTTFYNSVSTYAKTLWPGLKVATELTFDGITTYNSYAQTLNTNSDYIGVSYYPINSNFTVKPVSTIPIDFGTLVALYPLKPLYFYQYGYPSSPTCNSSETQQAQFITQTFTTWDTYASNVKKIDFTWLHDLDTAAVNFYGTYYGITDTIFLEFLHTLGLRTWNGNGVDKQAFVELECQAKQRGYNNLNINCTTGITDQSNNDNNLFIVFPNPVQNKLNIEMSFDMINAEIKIYNQLGQIEKTIS
ncbi:MAG: hypothetical protein O3A52_05925, partial [Bacteroidetes bacterium]|nr:hypothetical protein [Bacteroidota bacterium]